MMIARPAHRFGLESADPRFPPDVKPNADARGCSVGEIEAAKRPEISVLESTSHCRVRHRFRVWIG